MKNRTMVCFFILVFWGLMICTILSDNIHRQMTAKVMVIKKEQFSSSGVKLPLNVLFSDKNGLHLYEAAEGDNWEKGKHVQEVPSYQYQIGEEDIVVSGGAEYGYIQYASKAVTDGDAIQIVSQSKTEEELYLRITEEEENVEEWIGAGNLIEKKNGVLLFSMAGKQPYMEEQMRGDLSIAEGGRLYNLNEVTVFFRNLPLVSALFVFLLLFFIIWVCSCILLRDWDRNKYFLIGNLGAALLLLAVFIEVACRISLPSSLLPDKNIFELSYYKNEFLEIVEGLRKLSGVIALGVRESLKKEIVLAKGIGLLGGMIGIGILILEKVCSQKSCGFSRKRFKNGL